MPEATDPNSPLAILLQLEAMARAAESLAALRFLAVNESRRLIPYRQAFVFSGEGSGAQPMRVEAASSVTTLDRNAPFVGWVESFLKSLSYQALTHVSYFDRAHSDQRFHKEWLEYSMPYVLWCPLALPDGTVIGGIWLGRDTPWLESEQTLVKRLADTYAHAMGALTPRKSPWQRAVLNRRAITAVIVVAAAVFSLPVRMSALAPAEIVAKEPLVVTAPMDGVITAIGPSPNSEVVEGDLLFEYDDTRLRNKKLIAERALQVGQAELRAASQGAFLNEESRANVSLLRAQVAQNQTELDYAEELLHQVAVRAEQSGLLLYRSKNDWVGKPVQTGERVMQIANPRRVEVELRLPVSDAIVLLPGSEVRLFLDKDPLKSIEAVLTHASYHATPTDEQILAYRLTAELRDQDTPVRIGLQGTGKVYGG